MNIAYIGNESDFSKEIFISIVKNKINYNMNLLLTVNTDTKPVNYLKRLSLCCIKKIFNPFDLCTTNINYLTFKNYVPKNVEYLVTNNLNTEEFINRVRILNIDICIVAGCNIIFKNELINSFNTGVVNYHNSLLPKYKGINAESMAHFYYEKEFGYTFHWMNNEIDKGNIILQKSILIDYNKAFMSNHKKLVSTLSSSTRNLLALLSNNYKGIKQRNLESYYGNKELKKIITIENIDNYTYDQLIHIIYCFGYFSYKKYKITKINKKKQIIRINYIPYYLYKWSINQ